MVEIRKHVMEKQGKKLKVLVAHTPLYHSDVRTVKKALELESSKRTPIIFVMHEFFHARKRPPESVGRPSETPVTVRNGRLVIDKKPKNITQGDNRVLKNLNRLQALAKEHNAYLVYAGREKEKTKKNSVFVLTPAGPSIVRRKISFNVTGRFSKIAADHSVKVININSFHVLPLICYEFGETTGIRSITHLLKERFKDHVNFLVKSKKTKRKDAIKELSHTMPFYTKGVDIVAVPSQARIWSRLNSDRTADILCTAGFAHNKTIFANTGQLMFKNTILTLDGRPVGKRVSLLFRRILQTVLSPRRLLASRHSG